MENKPMMTRGQFLSRVGTVCAMAGIVPASVLADNQPETHRSLFSPSIQIKDMHLSTFKPLVNQSFRLNVSQHGGINLKLTNANDLSIRWANKPGQIPRESFSLLFNASKKEKIESGTYELEHKAFGKVPLFISPCGEKSDGVRYEIIFNRLK